MKNITYLDLTKNRLISLPDEICECNKLTDLHLSENLLQSLPDMIGNFYLLLFIYNYLKKILFKLR
jgi:Leucine-rich repeat (LRR) protein